MIPMNLTDLLHYFPFIAITRGILPEEAVDCAGILYNSGFRIIETPLNSPEPLRSIRLMADLFEDRALVGAGTVTSVEQVEQVREAGGRLVVSPHCDPALIRESKRCGLISIPGVVTPTEAFTALQAGADALKLFPAEIVTPKAVRAMRAVLPKAALLIPVGSIHAGNWQEYVEAGANGFGLGSSLYRKGIAVAELQGRAETFRGSLQQYRSRSK